MILSRVDVNTPEDCFEDQRGGPGEVLGLGKNELTEPSLVRNTSLSFYFYFSSLSLLRLSTLIDPSWNSPVSRRWILLPCVPWMEPTVPSLQFDRLRVSSKDRCKTSMDEISPVSLRQPPTLVSLSFPLCGQSEPIASSHSQRRRNSVHIQENWVVDRGGNRSYHRPLSSSLWSNIQREPRRWSRGSPLKRMSSQSNPRSSCESSQLWSPPQN